ncbi:hypothetical protein ONZ51_g8245 [Trametes cubensis]|uniref:Protein-S-isoprenylcysteine O-methyltransferase n=1 Tax=Trametes cubensis TaxID=1111947 RepID=A0AAD7TP01_9APHY|nr:hypothetical protein ONZ51_g8245 [Trametes cubensis]
MEFRIDYAYALNMFKVLLLAGSAELFVVVVAPPKRAAGGSKPVYTGQLFEFLVRYMAYVGCYSVSASALCHSVLILYANNEAWTGNATRWLCPSMPPALDPLTKLSPAFIVGVFFVSVGAFIRLWAYASLGSLFTFEVVIKNNHRLITSGPYRLVRHPAYISLWLLLLGTHLIHFGEGGYVTYCNIAATPFVVVVLIWKVGSVFSVISLYKRCSIEDAQLRDRFKHEREDYRQAVPYALIPFVI